MESEFLQTNDLFTALVVAIAVGIIGFPAIILSIVMIKNKYKRDEKNKNNFE